MNNKGYIMTETLVVSGVILAALVLIYTQFAKINSTYSDSYLFNNVNDLYTLNQVGSYILEDNFNNLSDDLENYVDITDCSKFSNTDYCKTLIDASNIKYLLFTYNDKAYLTGALSKSNPYDLKLQKFVKTLDDSDTDYIYRLVAEFKDGTYASIPIYKNIVKYDNGTAIYFNPETGETCTDYVESNSSTGTKTGCMKWYVFNDDGSDTVNMILDHNTTAVTAWSSDGYVTNGPESAFMAKLKDDTSSWNGVDKRTDTYNFNNNTTTYTINYSGYHARIITSDEVAKITGNTSWNSNSAVYRDWFYLDNNSQTSSASSTNMSKYAWLFNYTKNCIANGCTNDDNKLYNSNNIYGYWTSDAIKDNSTGAWCVNYNGTLSHELSGVVAYTNNGIRPVITVSRSKIANRKYANGTAIYFNPETGKTCLSTEAVSTTGTKTGCMKWYIFNDADGNKSINLILDHNLDYDKVSWNSTNSNINGPSIEFLDQLKNYTSTWKGVPTRSDYFMVKNGTSTYKIDYNGYKVRLIDADEVAKITGNTSWNSNTATYEDWFYLDNHVNDSYVVNANVKSAYAWLYDYTCQCIQYGCNVEDHENDDDPDNSKYEYGYWTSSSIKDITTKAWYVSSIGGLGDIDISSTNVIDSINGTRPVITIPKYIINGTASTIDKNLYYKNGTPVYFNVTTGTKCDSSAAVSTTNTKSGCMKFYAFNDSENNSKLNLILDHNTTANNIKWDSTTNAKGPTTVYTQLKADTSSWVGVETIDNYFYKNSSTSYTINYNVDSAKARFITANEVAKITGNTSWNSSTATSSNYFFLDSNSTTQTATSKGASKYAWLYDYIYLCNQSGCNIEDNNDYNSVKTYGYWTSDSISGGTSFAWSVFSNGSLYTIDTSYAYYGIRPVITVLKSKLQ